MPALGEIGRAAVEDDPAADEQEPLDDVLDRAELVRDVRGSSRRSSRCSSGEQRGERLLGVHVDAGRRLVEDQEPRLGGERLGDEGTLLLAAGERRDRVARPAPSSPTRSIAASTARAVARSSAARAGARRVTRPAETTSRTVAGASIPSCARWARYADQRPARRRRRPARRRARAGPARRPLEAERQCAAASSCRRRSGRRSRRTRPRGSPGRRPASTGRRRVVRERDVVELDR